MSNNNYPKWIEKNKKHQNKNCPKQAKINKNVLKQKLSQVNKMDNCIMPLDQYMGIVTTLSSLPRQKNSRK